MGNRSAGTPRVVFVWAAAMLLLHAGAAAARADGQDGRRGIAGLTLEQLMTVDVQRVEGASRFEQQVLEAPSVVTIVTREQIYTYGFRTLADVLHTVRGFYVTNDRNYSYLGVQGFSRPGDYNTRVLLMIDGHRLNDNVFGQAEIGTELPLDLDLVDRIEIIRGATSSLYGTDAFFASIDIITLNPASERGTFGTAGTGSQRSVEVHGGVAHAFAGGTDVLLSATGYRSSGDTRLVFPDLVRSTPTAGVSANSDGDRSGSVFGTLRRGGWTAQLLWGSRTKEIPTGAFGTALSDPRSRTTDARGYVTVGYDGRWRGTSLKWNASYDHYAYDGTYALAMDDGSPDPHPYLDLARGDWMSSSLMLSRHVGRAQQITAGVELQDNLRQLQQVAPLPGVLSLDSRRHSMYASLFAEDEVRVTPRVLLNLGLRHDELAGDLRATSPRAALIVMPAQGSALKLLFGQAFRTPSVFESYYYGDTSAALRPERVTTLEAAWEQYVSHRFRVTGSFFANRTRDLVTQVPSRLTLDGVTFDNSGAIVATGAGAEIEGALPGHVHGTVSYTYTNAHQPRSADVLTNSPRHLLDVLLAVPILRTQWLAGISEQVVGRRLTVEGGWLPMTPLTNVTVTRRDLRGGIGVALDVRNLFSRAYGDPGSGEHPEESIPQDGRTARVRLTWHF